MTDTPPAASPMATIVALAFARALVTRRLTCVSCANVPIRVYTDVMHEDAESTSTKARVSSALNCRSSSADIAASTSSRRAKMRSRDFGCRMSYARIAYTSTPPLARPTTMSDPPACTWTHVIGTPFASTLPPGINRPPTSKYTKSPEPLDPPAPTRTRAPAPSTAPASLPPPPYTGHRHEPRQPCAASVVARGMSKHAALLRNINSTSRDAAHALGAHVNANMGRDKSAS
mmetsp:Transcript_6451/g.21134  ORF Transcript_6451/g.21134 Transcript_6451/m.21134 type:complete len:231 (-) Transcript_6451:1425-2117(-)